MAKQSSAIVATAAPDPIEATYPVELRVTYNIQSGDTIYHCVFPASTIRNILSGDMMWIPLSDTRSAHARQQNNQPQTTWLSIYSVAEIIIRGDWKG